MNRPALVLAAHGSHVERGVNSTIRAWARRIADLSLFVNVTAAFKIGRPTFASVLDELDAVDEVVVVPVMTSEGFCQDVVLPRELAKNERFERVRVVQTPTLGTHPRMSRVVAARIRALLAEQQLDPGTVSLAVVGHGSERHRGSQRTTFRLVDAMRRRRVFGEVLPAFLDEDPRVETVLDRADFPNVVVIPFFIGVGQHTTSDIPSRLGMTVPAGASPPFSARVDGRLVHCDVAIGTQPEIPGIIVELALEAMRSGDQSSNVMGTSMRGAHPTASSI